MALLVRTRRADLAIGGRGSLMDRCLAGGLPVASACSGRGACAKCMVTVLAGGDRLSPAGSHEAQTLARNGAGADQRLSCQCRVVDAAAEVLITTGYW